MKIKKRQFLDVLLLCAALAPSYWSVPANAADADQDPQQGTVPEGDDKPAPDTRFNNWKLISNSDGIKTYQRDTEIKYYVGFRGEITIDQPIEKVAALLADMESRKKWMDEVVETKRLHMKSIFDRVEYNHTKVPWPFQDRDFVYEAKVELDQKTRTMVIAMKSVEDPAMPEKDGVVRGEMKESRYFIRDLEDGKKTFISVEIMIDPKGAIPMWLVRLKQRKWPRNTLGGLRDYLSKNDIAIPEEFKVYTKRVK